MSTAGIDTCQTLETNSELGKPSAYDATYNPSRLLAIPRAGKRLEIQIGPDHLPFYGFDLWNHYEVSWLNEKGKPVVAIAEIVYDCRSPKLIESKSLKLYFNSFNNTRFKSATEVASTVKKDIEERVGSEVFVSLHELSQMPLSLSPESVEGESIDDLDISCSVYEVEPAFLSVHETLVEETLCTSLLKSNCLITGQPDWASVQIAYKGKQINREGLLKYIVSFRNHNEFHEQCIERIFMDLMTHCKLKELSVYGRFTRRGGLDINPFRSTQPQQFSGKNIRLVRQ
jgi:7-cyano-7-deazaguanine reductase